MMQRLFGPHRSWRWPAPIVEAYGAFAVLCWAVWAVGVGVIIGLVAWFSEIDGSIAIPASSLAFWFLGIFSGYLFHDVFAGWVANGRTRFDAAIEVGMLTAVIVVTLTVLATATVLVEWLVYRIAGWPTALPAENLLDDRARLHLFVLPLLFVGTTWAFAGALVGAAYYRWQGNGLVMLLPATVILGATSNFSEQTVQSELPFEWLHVSTPVSIILCIVGTGLLVALLWGVVRHTPVRRKT